MTIYFQLSLFADRNLEDIEQNSAAYLLPTCVTILCQLA